PAVDAVGPARTDGAALRRARHLEGTRDESQRQKPAGRPQPDDRRARPGDRRNARAAEDGVGPGLSGPPRHAAPCFLSVVCPVRSTSTVHSLTAAAMAATAASTGASTAPMTPIVSGNSAMVWSPCLMITRRTLPSCRSFLTASTSCWPATLNDSL